MSNLVRKEPEHLPAVEQQGSAIIDMIARAARDPSVDIDKMRQLLDMRAQEEARAAKRDFYAAMTDAQAQMGPVATDCSNTQTKSRYASYHALDRALRPIYTSQGFALSFGTEPASTPDCIRVLCTVSHRSGHAERYQIDMPADGKGAKGGDVMTKTHATGSATAYGMRYLLKMIFNIAIGESDDDGNAASAPRGAPPPAPPQADRISQQQADNLRDLITAKSANLTGFLTWARVQSVEHIRAEHYDSCIDAINQYKPKAAR